MLTFTPNAFFNELEKKSRAHKNTLRSAYYRSIKNGYIQKDDSGGLHITRQGRKQIQLYEPDRLPDNIQLLVAFDIPEKLRHERRNFRLLLKELKFEQIQKSVWVSGYDHTEYIQDECKEHQLEPYVRILVGRFIDLQ